MNIEDAASAQAATEKDKQVVEMKGEKEEKISQKKKVIHFPSFEFAPTCTVRTLQAKIRSQKEVCRYIAHSFWN